jgi:hypothetical protein
MDPDQALKNARKAAEDMGKYEPGTADWRDAAHDLADAFEALDTWLTKSGYLPEDWSGAH